MLPFGGATNPGSAGQAALYLRCSCLMILGYALNIYNGKILAVYGYHKQIFMVSLTGVIANISCSYLFVRILPADVAIAGLGMGTSVSSTLQFLLGFTLIRRKKIPLKLGLHPFSLKEFLGTLKLGFPTASNNLIDGVVSGVVNNIILIGFGGSAMALSVYTAVKGVFGFAQAAALGTGLATLPLFGVLFGARDKNGLKRTLSAGLTTGLLFCLCWCTALVLLLPLLLNFYGMPGNVTVQQGVYATFLFMPVILLLRLMTHFFESTENP